MNGSMDADELAAHLLEGLDALGAGPMLRGELARRLAGLGLAEPPPPPSGDRAPRRGLSRMDGAFIKAIEVASGCEIRPTYGVIRRVRHPEGRLMLSYSGTGQPRWNEVIDRHGSDAFADRVRQILEGEVGSGCEVGFGLGRTGSRTISLRPVEVAAEGSDPG